MSNVLLQCDFWKEWKDNIQCIEKVLKHKLFGYLKLFDFKWDNTPISNEIKYGIDWKTGWGLISNEFIKVCFDVTLKFYLKSESEPKIFFFKKFIPCLKSGMGMEIEMKATITLQHWGVYSYGMIIRQQYIQWVTSDMVIERRVFKANKLP